MEGLIQRNMRSDERRRDSRALAVLEYAGTPTARQVVEQLARGSKEAPLTQEAVQVLKRMQK